MSRRWNSRNFKMTFGFLGHDNKTIQEEGAWCLQTGEPWKNQVHHRAVWWPGPRDRHWPRTQQQNQRPTSSYTARSVSLPLDSWKEDAMSAHTPRTLRQSLTLQCFIVVKWFISPVSIYFILKWLIATLKNKAKQKNPNYEYMSLSVPFTIWLFST